MKIKEVCKTTGLTDKAIRFYISNGLIEPKYSENYAGRKNYYFSQDDINTLKTIAVLRYYDFSINHIKEMFSDDSKTAETLEEHISEIKKTANQSALILNSLQNASMSKITSIEDLSAALEENLSVKQQDRTKDEDINYKKILKMYSKKVKKKLPKLIALALLGVLTAAALITGIIIILVNFLLNLEGI